MHHILFAVIPAEAGIQRIMRGVCLDPGSALRAVRDDVIKKGHRPGGQAGWALRTGHDDALGTMERHILFAVIPAKAGIQRILRGVCLDPGSALRAVRDDVRKKGRAGRDDVKRGVYRRGGRSTFDVIPGPPQAEPGIQ